MINHGVEDSLGVLVTIVDALLNFHEVGSAQVSVQSTLAGDHLENFFLSILATEAESYEVGSGNCTGALGSEWAFTIECVRSINSNALLVGGYRDTSTQVADDEVHLLIFLANLTGKAACNSLLVKWMPNAHALDLGDTADASIVIQLVNNNGVGDETAATGNLLSNLVGNEAAQVAGVLASSIASVLKHFLVNLIYATRNGFAKTSTANDGLKVEVYIGDLDLVHYKVVTEIKLVKNRLIWSQLLGFVTNRAKQQWGLTLVNGKLS